MAQVATCCSRWRRVEAFADFYQADTWAFADHAKVDAVGVVVRIRQLLSGNGAGGDVRAGGAECSPQLPEGGRHYGSPASPQSRIQSPFSGP